MPEELDPLDPVEWENIAKKIVGEEVADPVEARKEAELEKQFKKLMRRERLQLFVAGLTIILLTSFLIMVWLAVITEILADEGFLSHGFGFWNSFLIGLVTVLVIPGIRTGLNFRNS